MQELAQKLQEHFSTQIDHIILGVDMPTIELKADQLLAVCRSLYSDPQFDFKQLTDICGVDYLNYGIDEWRTVSPTESGFSRGVDVITTPENHPYEHRRFASVYHLLSLTHNHRLRLRVFLGAEPIVPSVIDIWHAADWFEREAFDLYGIVYDGHPDLRRLLTDYGFKGYPFRKDFPLIGEVELRYDAAQQRCIYEPVSIQPRVTVPKVIREDHRYD